MVSNEFLPTRNLDEAKRALDVHGFCLIASALPEEEIQRARKRLIEQASAEAQRGLAFRDGGHRQDVLDAHGVFKDKSSVSKEGGVNQRMFMLIDKGKVFRDLVINTFIDELVGHVLGEDFLLSTLSANIVRPGCVRMGLHTDQWWMPQPARPDANHRRVASITRHPAPEYLSPDKSLGIAPPVTVTAVWMLTDFTRENGATELVPGTHISGAYPDRTDQERYGMVQPEAPAGTLMVFDGRLWHGNGANTGTTDRIGVLATYCAPQFRQQENMILGLSRSTWEEIPPKLRARLGYRVWNGYGRVEAEFAGYVTPDSRSHGELTPQTP